MQFIWIGQLLQQIALHKMRLFWIILILFALGFLLIISNNNLALYKAENWVALKELSFSWLNQIYKNIQVLTGKAVEMNWTLRNL